MPWSVFDVGLESILQPVIDQLDGDEKRAAEADRDTLYTDPRNPGLMSWEWKGEDEVPWPTRITILGGCVRVRYAVISNYPKPAVVAASLIENPGPSN
jgi:hypothetical protein